MQETDEKTDFNKSNYYSAKACPKIFIRHTYMYIYCIYWYIIIYIFVFYNYIVITNNYNTN